METGRGWLARSAVAFVLAGSVVTGGLTAARASSSDAPAPEATPVIMVHGYSGSASCPGTDVTKAIWSDAFLKLYDAGWPESLLRPVSYYACDTDGVDITGYGPTPPDGGTADIVSNQPRVAYYDDTTIEQLAHDLAWFVYDTFSAAGTPVDLVGYSMGGLIMRYALYRVAALDPGFPPVLDVPRAVTISTPHAGLAASSSCGDTVQCDEMASDSPFITDLDAQAPNPEGTGGTAWTVVGSSGGCDLVPASSALAMPAAERVDYVNPCYSHADYMWDYADTADATVGVTLSSGAQLTDGVAPHALLWLTQVLSDSFAPIDSPPSPTPTSTAPTSLPPTSSPPPSPSPTPTSSPPPSPSPTPTSSPPPSPSPPPTSSPPPSPSPTPTSSTAADPAPPPVVQLRQPAALFQAGRSIRITYQADQPASYDVRYRVAAWDSRFGDYLYPSAWQGRATTTLTTSGRPGREYCYSVRATSDAGSTSSWSPERCVAIPLDDRSLNAVTPGWRRTTSTTAYEQTLTRTATRGARLRVRNVHTDRVALVVVACPRCGTLGIYLNGTLWRTADTRAATRRYKVILVQPRFSLRITTVALADLGGGVVIVDGLGVART